MQRAPEDFAELMFFADMSIEGRLVIKGGIAMAAAQSLVAAAGIYLERRLREKMGPTH